MAVQEDIAAKILKKIMTKIIEKIIGFFRIRV